MRIAIAQIDPTPGALSRNADKILAFARDAARQGADLVVFPEMAVTGYPVDDLLERDAFVDAIEASVNRIVADAPEGLALIVGAPVRNTTSTGKALFNAALLIERGAVLAEIHKSLLPTYEVYDEYRYFEPARRRRCVEWRGRRLGLHICEDMWNSDAAEARRMYAVDPLQELADDGADIFINLSANPFSVGQRPRRHAVLANIARRFERPFVLANQVGANAELIFDGDSTVHLADGRLAAVAPSFEEALVVWNIESHATCDVEPRDENEATFRALALGICDYYRKGGSFDGALVSMSGGIDSTLTAALAVEALGADNVLGLMMPAEYTRPSSIEDARAAADRLGIRLREIRIDRVVAATLDLVRDGEEQQVDVVEENVQARIRAVVQMALSNESGRLVLACGNKSEAAVGYTTLYGDLTGGLGVLADVYKTQVYELARFVNRRAGGPVIPEHILTKPPSAELRPGQADQDALPPYEVLDSILKLYVDERLGLDAIAARAGIDRSLVAWVIRKVDAAEFKRRQAPPGLRISRRAFGTGYRMPLASGWTHDVMHASAS